MTQTFDNLVTELSVYCLTIISSQLFKCSTFEKMFACILAELFKSLSPYDRNYIRLEGPGYVVANESDYRYDL